MASYQLQVLNSSLSVTKTVTDTTNTISASYTGNGKDAKVAVDGSGNARFLGWFTSTIGPTKTGRFCHIVNIGSSDTTFTLPAGSGGSSTEGEYLGMLGDCTPVGAPFYMAATGRYYQAVLTHNQAISLADHLVMVDVTEARPVNALSRVMPMTFRPAACLDNYAAIAPSLGMTSIVYRPSLTTFNSATNTVLMNSAVATSGAGHAVVVHNLVAGDPTTVSFCHEAMSGGFCGQYDGNSVNEYGFYQKPTIDVSTYTGTSSIAAGSYSYLAIYTARDASGKLHYSKCSDVMTVSPGAAFNADLSVMCPTILAKEQSLVCVEFYRTTNGGTTYRRCAQYVYDQSAYSSSPSGLFGTTVTDTMTDAVLLTKPSLFRQPGTIGTALDRCAALGAKHLVRKADRVFYANGNNVYYSSFEIDGESPWFSPAFVIYVPGGYGPITGLGVIDDTLVIFKMDGAWIVQGQGPTENGGNGTEFSQPQKIHTEYGCIDPRTIVSTPLGLMYRSSRGIELLDRNLKVQFIGERVMDTVDANPVSGGATFDITNGRAYFCMSNSLASTLGLTYNQPGVVMCYDTVNDAWSTLKFTNTSNTYGNAITDVAAGFSKNDPFTYSGLFLADHNTGVYISSLTTRTDNGAYIPWVIETGWVRNQSRMDRLKVTDLTVLARRTSGHNMKGTFYRDYNRTSGTLIKEFDATATNVTPEILEFQPSIESCSSMKFRIEGVTPSNPTTLGDGTQLEILGLTVRVGAKNGGIKLPAAQKG